ESRHRRQGRIGQDLDLGDDGPAARAVGTPGARHRRRLEPEPRADAGHPGRGGDGGAADPDARHARAHAGGRPARPAAGRHHRRPLPPRPGRRDAARHGPSAACGRGV
ncbi:MAG: hypothetical protein AVDCRST_MAG13-2662, partial [uncultured Solirubrobacteraceae bacterium]